MSSVQRSAISPRSDFQSNLSTSNIQNEPEDVYLDTHEEIQRVLTEKDQLILHLSEKLRIIEQTDGNQVAFNQKAKDLLSNMKKSMQKKVEEVNK